jgi:hypothetical protein
MEEMEKETATYRDKRHCGGDLALWSKKPSLTYLME